ncbi:hypothetical protein [Erythrobacter cryptus]|uniref:hypothetical protein n=1 Tax=Erythrobacter cryptus TaxID=196588 RepID=UPI0012EC68EB|nr:hypothetical protein [Erythrobacter cryptus]
MTMLRCVPVLLAAVSLASLAGCSDTGNADGGGGRPDAVTNGAQGAAAIAANAAAQGDAPITATRAEVEQAHECRGLMGAAFAAKTVIKDGLPEELAGMTSDAAMYWTVRADRLRAPDMTEAELDALTAASVRVLATPQAIANALPDIRACLAAQGAG